LRAVHNVFFGEYDEHKWHDMRPILAIDKFALIMFCALMIIIGLAPNVIAPIVESGMLPVVQRVQNAQQVITVMDSVQVAALNFLQLLGGA
jgi:NADH:ubiquinone oxidoreductase subunit 4 (subunit M)